TTSGCVDPISHGGGGGISCQPGTAWSPSQFKCVSTTTTTTTSLSTVSTPASPSQVSTPSSTPRPTFTLYLKQGSNNLSVLNLQKYLNSIGILVAESGPGSRGHETSFFGILTQIAVSRFQNLHGITPTGTVGPITRSALNWRN